MRHPYKVYLTVLFLGVLFGIHLSTFLVAEDKWGAASLLFLLDGAIIIVVGLYVIHDWLKSIWEEDDDDLLKEAVGDHPIPNELVLAEVEEFGVISYKLLQYRENPPHWVVYPDANSPGYTQHSPCCPAIRWVYVSDIFRL